MSTTTTLPDRKILLLGAGFVTTTVIEYLTRRRENIVTIATRSIEKAQQKRDTYAHNADQIKIESLDIENDDDKLMKLIGENDVVISLVPYTYHVKVAKMVLKQNEQGHKVNMVTSSYISADMEKLDEEAKKLGVTIFNSIGVDPGIDHLYAVKFIEAAHKKGDKVRHFESWCGGLPAPDSLSEGNPLKYKFSWSPRGVLMAGTNEARYLKDGETVIVAPQDLMNSAVQDLSNLHKDFEFEGYPNRDSTVYAKEYGIPESTFILRGTLRYKGFAHFMRALKGSGLVNFEPARDLKGKKWADVSAKVLEASSTSEDDLAAALLKKLNVDANSEEATTIVNGFKWIGIFSNEVPVHDAGTLADALSYLLEQKMSFKKGERDMIFMQNKFIMDKANGKTDTITATMILYGDREGKYTAMAKGTGYPCVIATQLVLDGIIKRTGVFAPHFEEVNDPIMGALMKEDIKMDIVAREE